MHLYLRASPRRSLVLVPTGLHESRSIRLSRRQPVAVPDCNALALILTAAELPACVPRGGQPDKHAGMGQIHAEVVPVSSLLPELPRLRRLTSSPAAGCLGLLPLGSDVFLSIVTFSTEVGDLRPGETVMRVQQTQFYSLGSAAWDGYSSSGGGVSSEEMDTEGKVSPVLCGDQLLQNHDPCADVRRTLSDGTFHYADNAKFDLSSPISRRHKPDSATDAFDGLASYDEDFVWNQALLAPLLDGVRACLEPDQQIKIDRCGLFLPIIRGSVGVVRLPPTYPLRDKPMHLALVSRVGHNRPGAGPRNRGLDDDGNAASFVETETILSLAGITYSHTQIRGSAPVFWEEQANLASLERSRIVLTRPWISSQPIFARHWARLVLKYGRIQGLSLLNTRGNERALSDAYRDHVCATSGESVHKSAEELVQDLLLGRQEEENYEALSTSGVLDLDPELTEWDVNAFEQRLDEDQDQMRNELRRHPVLSACLDRFGYTVVDSESKVRIYQQGVVRTNCLDGAARTNVVQSHLSCFALFSFFVRAASAVPEESSKTNAAFVPYASPSHPLFATLSRLWAQNGDVLSTILSNSSSPSTTASSASFAPDYSLSSTTGNTRSKSSWGGIFSSVVNSISRTYQSAFQSTNKQSAQEIGEDLLLGLAPEQQRQRRQRLLCDACLLAPPLVRLEQKKEMLELEDCIQHEMLLHQADFAKIMPLHVLVSTFNVAASVPDMRVGWDDELVEWLKPLPDVDPPELIVLGFQELVPLNASQVLMADDSQRRQWENVVLLALERIYGTGENGYHVLRSEQLVGTAVVVIARASLIAHVGGIETDTKKTGFRGMSGNKGGVAVRLTIRCTTYCFVVAHLAAGQQQAAERAADISSINQSVNFGHGLTIDAHDQVVWLGDLNYRIELPATEVRRLANAGRLPQLQPHDQLIQARTEGNVLSGLLEGPLDFRPSYKYDIGTDQYDSSEKQRAPAWTDRILFTSRDAWKLQIYTAAERPCCSDHRPVSAVFSTEMIQIDRKKQQKLYVDLVRRLAPPGRLPFLASHVQRKLVKASHSLASTRDEVSSEPAPSSLPDRSDAKQHWWPAQTDLSDDTASNTGLNDLGFSNLSTNSFSNPSSCVSL